MIEERVNYLLNYLDRLIELSERGFACNREISAVLKELNVLYGIEVKSND